MAVIIQLLALDEAQQDVERPLEAGEPIGVAPPGQGGVGRRV